MVLRQTNKPHLPVRIVLMTYFILMIFGGRPVNHIHDFFTFWTPWMFLLLISCTLLVLSRLHSICQWLFLGEVYSRRGPYDCHFFFAEHTSEGMYYVAGTLTNRVKRVSNQLKVSKVKHYFEIIVSKIWNGDRLRWQMLFQKDDQEHYPYPHDWCFKDLTATEYSGLVNLQMLLQLSLSELDKLQEETFRFLNNMSLIIQRDDCNRIPKRCHQFMMCVINLSASPGNRAGLTALTPYMRLKTWNQKYFHSIKYNHFVLKYVNRFST